MTCRERAAEAEATTGAEPKQSAEQDFIKAILPILDEMVMYLGGHWETEEQRDEVRALQDRVQEARDRFGRTQSSPATGGLCSLRMRAVLLQMQDEAKAAPSRERSLAITNLEQAIMWQDKAEPQDVLISGGSEAAEREMQPEKVSPPPQSEPAPAPGSVPPP